MDLHSDKQTLISRHYGNFVKIDHNKITYEGIWFYSDPYDLPNWLFGIVVRLPRWVNCSSRLEREVVDVLVGDPRKL